MNYPWLCVGGVDGRYMLWWHDGTSGHGRWSVDTWSYQRVVQGTGQRDICHISNLSHIHYCLHYIPLLLHTLVMFTWWCIDLLICWFAISMATNACVVCLFICSWQDSGRHPTEAHLERDTFIHGHSTPQMAGKFSKAIRARKLVLTHFSPRYRGDDSDYSMKTMWRFEHMARKASGLWGRNDVIAAWDQVQWTS